MKKEDTKAENKHISTSKSLDDEQRVKVLSPGAMVAKRFFRNRLAMVGLVILICMFLFAFVGGEMCIRDRCLLRYKAAGKRTLLSKMRREDKNVSGIIYPFLS